LSQQDLLFLLGILSHFSKGWHHVDDGKEEKVFSSDVTRKGGGT
jgi:hypothetical protein